VGTLLLLLLPAAILGPAALVLWLLYRLYPGEPPPARRILQVYLVGFGTALPAVLLEVVLLLALLPALVADVPLMLVVAMLALGIGLIEEGVKLVFLNRLAISQPEVRVPYDAVIFAMAVGFGFATVENREYLFSGAATGEDTLLAVMVIGRLALATPAHALLGAIMGYHAGLGRFALSASGRRWGRMLAYLHPAAWHALYDFFAIGTEQAHGRTAVLAWAGFALTVAALWAIGLLLIRRARKFSRLVMPMVEPSPVWQTLTTPGPLATAAPRPPTEVDLSVWARPQGAAERGR
jgi:RsiW-degrading membrane proteinase PrsW (M82 family)